MQPCLLGSSVASFGAPWGWRRSVAGWATSLDDTGTSLAVEQSLCGLCPKCSPRWKPLLVYPSPRSVRGLGSMCTRVPAVRECTRVPAVRECTRVPAVRVCTRVPAVLECTRVPAVRVCTWVPAVWECTQVPAVLGVHMGAPVCDGLPSLGLVAR